MKTVAHCQDFHCVIIFDLPPAVLSSRDAERSNMAEAKPHLQYLARHVLPEPHTLTDSPSGSGQSSCNPAIS